MKKALVLLVLLTLTACAHVVSEEMRREAGVAPPVERLFEHPEEYTGRTVILGGVIINTNPAEDATYIEVLQAPLDSQGRPGTTDATAGRFLVSSERYLDPAIYATGRKLTVAGTLIGTRQGTVGEAPYTYPLIDGKELHLIKETAGPRLHIGVGVFHSF